MVGRFERCALIIVEKGGQIASVEITTPKAVDASLRHVRAFSRAILSLDLKTVKIGLQHRIDHTGHRVCAIDGGGTVP